MKKARFIGRILGTAIVLAMLWTTFGGSPGIAQAADKFNIGDTVEVTANLNVREGAGTSYPEITDPDYPGYAPEGTIGEVLDGPSSADGYIWWQVDFGPGLYSGWAVEDWLEYACSMPGRDTPEKAPDFFDSVLSQLSLPINDFALEALEIWTRYENTEACWNPLATTWDMGEKSWDFNAAGVKNYVDEDTGVEATANTLSLSYYEAIRQMLARVSFDEEAIQQAVATWSGLSPSDPYAVNLVNEWKELYQSDSTPPVVTAFNVVPSSVTPGNPFAISYTISDTGGSGLGWIQLWRKYETASWEQVDSTTLSGVGNGPYPGSFSDTPLTVGTYWYGIHIGDGAGNWVTETDSGFSPIEVEVIPADNPPQVTTEGASSVTTSSAVLTGNLDSTGGETCQVWFDYGTSTSYGSSTSKLSVSSTGPFTTVISGLNPDTTYHFRACAQNGKETSYGSDVTFKTEPANEIVAPGKLSQNNPRKLARTSDGVLHCVYSRSDGSYSQIYHSYSTDEGESWIEEAVTDAPYRHENPSIATDSKDYIHVVWDTRQGSGSSETCAIQYRVKTTTWQDIEDVINQQSLPSLAIDSHDNVHLVVGGKWGGAYSCHYVRYIKRTPSGWGSPETVSSNCWGGNPAVAIDEDNDAHVVYTHSPKSGSHYGLRYRKRTASGWQSEEIIQTDDHDWSPGSIALASSGNIYVLYYLGSYSGVSGVTPGPIMMSMRTSSGWQTAEEVCPASEYPQKNPSISVDSNDALHVVWQGKHSGSPDYYQIRYRKYTTGWSLVQDLTSASVDQEYSNLIWAWWPVVSDVRTSRPKDGYAFVWNDGSDIKFYRSSDLEWGTGAGPKIWYVDDDLVDYPAADFTTIQEAVDAANSGDSIIIYPGTYTENINVNKDHLTIQSENGAETTIIKPANLNEVVFHITVDEVEVSGFTTDRGAGAVYLANANYCSICHNIIKGTGDGITLSQSHNNVLSSNTLDSNNFGIFSSNAHNNTLVDNHISNSQLTGLLLQNCSNNTLTGNIMSNNRWNFDVTGIYGDHRIDTTNKVNGKPIQYIVNQADLVIDSTWDVGYIGVVNSRGITVRDLSLSNNGEGVLFINTHNSKIENVDVSNNRLGISLGTSSHIMVINNKASYNFHEGISLIYSSNNIVYLNNFDNGGHVYPESSPNIWHSPEEITYTYNGNTYTNYLGNYWSDYEDRYPGAGEIGLTGVWDTPYDLASDADDYPLVAPFENYETGPVPYPVITVPLEITAKDIYYVGDTLASKFTITNRGTESITFDVLLVGGRGPTGEVVDFGKSYDVMLNPGDSHAYQGYLTLPEKPGTYHFFCAYHTEKHTPGEDECNWNTNIDVEVDGEIIQDFNEARRYRERDITVFEETYVSPAPPPALWEEISGPWEEEAWDISTRLLQITVHPNSPEVIYAIASHDHYYWGYVGDTLYRSTNGGLDWTPTNAGLHPAPGSQYYWPIGAIAIAPSDSDVIYVGTSAFDPYSDLTSTAKGIYKSTNGGAEWTPIAGPYFTTLLIFKGYYPISSMAVHPADPGIVYVGTVGGGIWRTTNGGESWEKIWDLPVHRETLLEVVSLAISPANPSIVYAAAYNFAPSEAMGWSGILIPAHLIKSEDSGDTWETLLEVPFGKIDDIAVSETDAHMLYTITGVTESYSVDKSVDGGEVWDDASGSSGLNPLPDVDPVLRTIGMYGTTGKMGSICVHPDYDRVIYASGEWGFKYIYFSPDSGENWFPLGDLKDRHVKDLVLASGIDSRILYAATIEGLYRVDISSSMIVVQQHSPGELRVYDSEGRVTGLVDGEIKEEIPESAYFDNTAILFSPSSLDRYEIAGVDAGTYGLTVTSVEDEDATAFAATDIPITPGTVHQYIIDWDALSQGEEGVTAQIDSDGDGIFESTVTSDDELTHDEFLHETIPQLIKEDAISSLDTIEPSKRAAQRFIDNSRWFINKSLADRLWIDDSHLCSAATGGALVFDMEKAAVLKLEIAKRIDPSIEDEIEAVIDKLTNADKLLCIIAINDAKSIDVENARKQKIVGREIAKAEERLDKAYEYLERDMPVQATTYFKLSWMHAQTAIKFAQTTGVASLTWH
jgi:parallel beta-helix repeat protein